jgi:hypothetical protein
VRGIREINSGYSRDILKEGLKNRVGGTKTGLDEVEGPLGEV